MKDDEKYQHEKEMHGQRLKTIVYMIVTLVLGIALGFLLGVTFGGR